MARVLSAISRRRHGSVGGETYRVAGGITVVSEKSEGPTGDPTQLQIMQRAAFAMAVSLWEILWPILKIGFKQHKRDQNAFNFFISVALKSAFDFSDPSTVTFLPEKLLIAKGSMRPVTITSATCYMNYHLFIMSFSDKYIGNENFTDVVKIVLYNETRDMWCILNDWGISREFGHYTTEWPATFQVSLTDTIRAYLFFEGQVIYWLNDLYRERTNGIVSTSTNTLVTILPVFS